MTALSQLEKLLATPLPCPSQQRRKPYRPREQEIRRVYSLLNRAVFNGVLRRPEIKTGRETNALGWCIGMRSPTKSRSGCIMRLTDKWFSVHWLIFVMAHEMCHQYQWDIIGPQRQAQGQQPSTQSTISSNRSPSDKTSSYLSLVPVSRSSKTINKV